MADQVTTSAIGDVAPPIPAPAGNVVALPGRKTKGKAPPHETVDIGVHTFSLIEIDGAKYVHGHPVYGPFEVSELPDGLGLFCEGVVRIDCDHNVVSPAVEG